MKKNYLLFSLIMAFSSLTGSALYAKPLQSTGTDALADINKTDCNKTKETTQKVDIAKASDLNDCVNEGYNDKKVALIISNSDYQHASKLYSPANDGKLIRHKLRKLGFSVNLVADANTSQMRDAISKFGKQTSNADAAIFYYAGHGIQDDASRNYLLPVTTNISSASDISSNGVDAHTIITALNKAKPRVSLVMFDINRHRYFSHGVKGVRDFGLLSLEADSEILGRVEDL